MPENRSILVVDDSIDIVESLKTILGLKGFRVNTAYNGSEALRKIRDHSYDLIICDIEMPGLSGLEFLGKVRKEFDENLKVILMTGHLDHDYFIEAIRLGANDFIRKPIDTQQLINSMRELLFRKAQINDLSSFCAELEESLFAFKVSAETFSKFSIARIVTIYFRQFFTANSKTLNELLLCVDEIAYNAYIHGTLGLTIEERALPNEEMQKVIAKRLEDDKLRNRRIEFGFEVDNIRRIISVSCKDEGKGFDYESWMRKVQTEPFLEIESHGRGISILHHLCDEIIFADGGRHVTIRKKY